MGQLAAVRENKTLAIWLKEHWTALSWVVFLAGILVLGAAYLATTPVAITYKNDEVMLPAHYTRVVKMQTTPSDHIAGVAVGVVTGEQFFAMEGRFEPLNFWIRPGDFFDSIDTYVNSFGKEGAATTHAYFYQERLVPRQWWDRGYVLDAWQVEDGRLLLFYKRNWVEIAILAIILVGCWSSVMTVISDELGGEVYRWYYRLVSPPQ